MYSSIKTIQRALLVNKCFGGEVPFFLFIYWVILLTLNRQNHQKSWTNKFDNGRRCHVVSEIYFTLCHLKSISFFVRGNIEQNGLRITVFGNDVLCSMGGLKGNVQGLFGAPKNRQV